MCFLEENYYTHLNPIPEFNIIDSKELREKILSLSASEANKLGIRKSTLWHIKNRVKNRNQLRIYTKTITKLSKRTSSLIQEDKRNI